MPMGKSVLAGTNDEYSSTGGGSVGMSADRRGTNTGGSTAARQATLYHTANVLCFYAAATVIKRTM